MAVLPLSVHDRAHLRHRHVANQEGANLELLLDAQRQLRARVVARVVAAEHVGRVAAVEKRVSDEGEGLVGLLGEGEVQRVLEDV